MFSVHCPRHGQQVLLGHRQILGIDGRGRDMTVRYRCWCGHHGAHHPQAAAPAPAPAATPTAA
jgi:hypothetical protein